MGETYFSLFKKTDKNHFTVRKIKLILQEKILIMINFENTEIAFKRQTSSSLKKANFLFRTIANNIVLKIGKMSITFANSLHIPIAWAVKPTIYKQFCGGETIKECEPLVKILAKYNVESILDYSVEGSEKDEDIMSAMTETLKTIDNASINDAVPFAVFKPTAFGKKSVLKKVSFKQELTEDEKNEYDKFKGRINKLCRVAYDKNVKIMIDAEDYAYQDAIDKVIEQMMEKYNFKRTIVFTTLQMYRVDKLDYLKELYAKSVEKSYFLGIKFVRGAYMERERRRAKEGGYISPIHINKEATDKDYNEALKFSMEHIDRIAIFNGTHNEESSAYLTKLMDEKSIDKNDERCYYSQLYGMSDNISFNLAKEGYNVAKYLPYGPVKNVLPYLIRRAEENSSIAGQTNRELTLIKKELKRRKFSN